MRCDTTYAIEASLVTHNYSCTHLVSTLYQAYKLTPSYPTKLIVPADVDDDILQDIAAYRQNSRIPVLTYMHSKTKAPLLVAGEPRAGDKKRCYEDERMFRSILQAR